MPRTAFHADESFFDNGQYLVIEIVEGEAGYDVTERRAKLPDAVAEAARLNAALGLSADEVWEIRSSSMRADPNLPGSSSSAELAAEDTFDEG